MTTPMQVTIAQRVLLLKIKQGKVRYKNDTRKQSTLQAIVNKRFVTCSNKTSRLYLTNKGIQFIDGYE